MSFSPKTTTLSVPGPMSPAAPDPPSSFSPPGQFHIWLFAGPNDASVRCCGRIFMTTRSSTRKAAR